MSVRRTGPRATAPCRVCRRGCRAAAPGTYCNASGKIAVNAPEAVRATPFWRDLLTTYGVKGIGHFDREQNRIAITQGKAAMPIDATANSPFNEDPKPSVVAGKVGYVPVHYAIANPPGTGNTDNSPNVHALRLSAFSKHKDPAYTFAAWATSKAGREANRRDVHHAGRHLGIPQWR
ncbi:MULTISPECIES: extracellular solute-binding protein [unclassified Streptomyces]|uniref:extracellular solute-binding protein n=1 Tax=unclassified Streptomyces TaxID=2593676 RepID=UPI0038071D9C